jgi:RNA polymerase sigma factor (sigma-70 family)
MSTVDRSFTDDPLAPLAARALEGEARAADALCRELQAPLYRLAVRLLSDVEDARDATQEALVLVITHLSTFRGDSRVLTWAYSIALRHVLRTRRKRERSRSRLALELKIRAGLLLTGADAGPDGEQSVLRRETCHGCTRAMLQCLTLDERAVIVLSELLGADDELGARLCGVADAAYRKRLSRARAKLRPVLEGLCGLTNPGNPCTCERQARAKQLTRRRPAARIPALTEGEVIAATERLGEVRRLGAVLAGPAPIAVPEDIWASVREHLSSVLEAPSPVTDGTEPPRR